jgi:outer membrane protein OmpA-like peptidoglycan-associated protein
MPELPSHACKKWAAGLLIVAWLAPGCALRREPETTARQDPDTTRPERTTRRDPDTTARREPAPRTERVTRRDKTLKGAGIGAGAGALGAVLIGKREADQILIGAAIGAAAGAGVGAYLDAQEERLGRIEGTTVERVDDDTLLVQFDSDLLFPVDSARPTPESLSTLAEVADVLVKYPKTAVVVQGHTDATGPAAYNLDLSERRALTVKDLLMDRGVAETRLAAIGHGEEFPIASNSFEEGRRRNRRVTVMLKAKAT